MNNNLTLDNFLLDLLDNWIFITPRIASTLAGKTHHQQYGDRLRQLCDKGKAIELGRVKGNYALHLQGIWFASAKRFDSFSKGTVTFEKTSAAAHPLLLSSLVSWVSSCMDTTQIFSEVYITRELGWFHGRVPRRHPNPFFNYIPDALIVTPSITYRLELQLHRVKCDHFDKMMKDKKDDFPVLLVSMPEMVAYFKKLTSHYCGNIKLIEYGNKDQLDLALKSAAER